LSSDQARDNGRGPLDNPSKRELYKGINREGSALKENKRDFFCYFRESHETSMDEVGGYRGDIRKNPGNCGDP